jgi:hypothetical protein
MRLADESKWLLACHSLWCGVNFSPRLGILWFNKSNRLTALTSINRMLENSESVDNTIKTLSILEYIVSICHWHVYLVRPLWKCCNPPARATTPTTLVTLNSEERGKLKILRKRITETPGTSLLRVVDMTAAPTSGGTEWAFQTDARIIPLKTSISFCAATWTVVNAPRLTRAACRAALPSCGGGRLLCLLAVV